MNLNWQNQRGSKRSLGKQKRSFGRIIIQRQRAYPRNLKSRCFAIPLSLSPIFEFLHNRVSKPDNIYTIIEPATIMHAHYGNVQNAMLSTRFFLNPPFLRIIRDNTSFLRLNPIRNATLLFSRNSSTLPSFQNDRPRINPQQWR